MTNQLMQKRPRARGPLLSASLVGLSGLAVPNSHAEGFRNPPAGSQALGRSGAKIALIDDATAVTHNPANLTEIGSFSGLATLLSVHVSTRYQGAAGTAETVQPWKLVPAFYVSAPLKDDRFVVALGISSPYGLSNEWDQDGAFKYTAPYFTELKTINFNPTFAWKISDKFSLGVGMDVMWSELTLKQEYPWALIVSNPAAPDGVLSGKGSGVGLGGNLGFTWNISEKHKVALSYRSQMTVDYDGDFELSNVPPGVPIAGQSSFGSSITFPNIVGLGYGYQVTPRLRLGADVEWLQFSNFETLPINVGSPAPLVPSEINQDWVNTFTFGVGGDWQFAEDWVWRFSYQYYQTPVPDETFSPTIPDANQNVITTSLGYRFGRNLVELAYGWVHYADREITTDQNPAYNGSYQTKVQLLSASYSYSF